MNLEKTIEVAHRIADPYIKSAEAWKYCCKVLAILLMLSVGANVYLATKGVEIIVEQENSFSDHNKVKAN